MAVTKRIFQLAKEFERDEKEIIAFLTTQGIKVSNRLSAVSEETYNMLKTKFMAPPEPEPAPAPAPAPKPAPEVKEEVAPAKAEATEAPAQQPQQQPQPAPGGKKKKKKNKQPQPAEAPAQTENKPAEQTEDDVKEVSEAKIENMSKRTQSVLYEANKAGNEFIRHYYSSPGSIALNRSKKPELTSTMDIWGILYNHRLEYFEDTPAHYWTSVAKLMTRAFKLMDSFGLNHRENFAEMRIAMAPLGAKYQPREIFTDEENQKFEAQQLLLFQSFGHGMGIVNDNLYDLKLKAERMKVKYELMNFVEYVTNPQAELRFNDRVPFKELVEAVASSLRGVARRYHFYFDNKERIDNIVKNFFEWIDGYAKLKEQGADAAKLEKYLKLEEKFVDIAEFMSFDNLIYAQGSKKAKKGKTSPFDLVLDLLHAYRDNIDDPDAERNFKYKVRGVINLIYKPKEFVFLYRFAELEPLKDYRPPEEVAAAEAAKKAAAEQATAEQENPAANDDEA